MTPAVGSDRVSAQQPSLSRACAILAAAVLGVTPLFAAYGYLRFGWLGIGAAAIGAGVCYGAAASALVITVLMQRAGQGVQGILGAMLIRMSIPLAALGLLPQVGGPLAEAGAATMLMGFYLVVLVVETWLSLQFVSHGKGQAAKAA